MRRTVNELINSKVAVETAAHKLLLENETLVLSLKKLQADKERSISMRPKIFQNDGTNKQDLLSSSNERRRHEEQFTPSSINLQPHDSKYPRTEHHDHKKSKPEDPQTGLLSPKKSLTAEQTMPTILSRMKKSIAPTTQRENIHHSNRGGGGENHVSGSSSDTTLLSSSYSSTAAPARKARFSPNDEVAAFSLSSSKDWEIALKEKKSVNRSRSLSPRGVSWRKGRTKDGRGLSFGDEHNSHIIAISSDPLIKEMVIGEDETDHHKVNNNRSSPLFRPPSFAND